MTLQRLCPFMVIATAMAAMAALGPAPATLQGADAPNREDATADAPTPGRLSWIPEKVEVVEGVVYAEADLAAGRPSALALDAAFLRRSGDEPLPVLMYVHGGGWVGGDRSLGRMPIVVYALGGYLAVSIDYRLADVATFPAQLHDVRAAIRFIRANAGRLGVDPERIGLVGHSAGGHLSILAATSANEGLLDGASDATDPRIESAVACAVTVSGPSDLTVPIESPLARDLVGRFLGPGTEIELLERARLASPITHVDAEDPPTLVIHGTEDTIVPVEQARRFVSALEEAGVTHAILEVAGAGHAISGSVDDLRAARFLDRHLGGDAHGAMVELRRRLGGTLPASGLERDGLR